MAYGTQFGIVIGRKLDTRPAPQLAGKLVTVGNSTQEADYAQLASFMDGEWWYVVNDSLNPESNLFTVN
jgi:hypothetical protein